MKRLLKSKLLLLPFFIGAMYLTSCMDISMTNNNFTNEQVNDVQIVKVGLDNATTIEYVEYICSDNTNHLTVSGPIDEGHILISITDDQGNTVFNRKLSGYTTFDEDISGVSGIWTVELNYEKARGNLDFRLSSQ